MMAGPVFALHLACTGMMVGLIWLVQLETYPAFAKVGPEHFPTYHRFHTRRISLIVVPLMLLEFLSAVLLLMLQPSFFPLTSQFLGIALLVFVWLSTFLVQVPCHQRLSTGFDPSVHRRLVQSNWLRTFGWSTRLMVLLVVVICPLGGI